MSQQHPHGEPDELAADYVAGGMSDARRAEFEGHLRTGCTECSAALKSFDGVASALFWAVEPLDPDPAIRQGLLQRIAESAASSEAGAAPRQQAAQHARLLQEPPDLFVVRADEAGWKDAGIDGIQVRVLHVDRAQQRYTSLVRMQPGAIYTEHTHHAAEECFVLEGDLRVGDVVLRQGDYQRTAAGYQQAEQTTKYGCLLLLSTPLE